MAPPIFDDLGKATRDVFDKGYILERFKLTGKNNTCGALKMKTQLSHKFQDGKFWGEVEGTYPYPALGLTLTKTWNTDNVIGLAAEIANKIYPGVILKAEGQFNPDSGEKRGKATVRYLHDFLHAAFSTSAGTGSDPSDNLLLNGSLVGGYEGWLAGVKAEFDVNDNSVKSYFGALGHSYGNMQAFIIGKNLFGEDAVVKCNIYQRVANRLEMGLTFGLDMVPGGQGGEGGDGGGGGGKKKIYNLGARYLLTDDNSVRVKVDQDSKVGLCLESTLGGCVKLIFSVLVDGKKLNEGGHKYGLGVEIM